MEFVSLKREAAGFPLATLLVECATQAVTEGLTGEPALVKAASNALAEWCVRQARGIEEHALGENLTHERRRNINQRIENAICNADGLARQLLKIDTSVPTGRKPPKQGGLDDGVPIHGRRA